MRRSILGAWQAMALFVVVFALIYGAIKYLQSASMPFVKLESARDMAAFRGTFSVLLIWIEVLAMIGILRLRGQTLSDLGWLKRSSWWGWLAALIVVAIYVGFALTGPMLKGAPLLTDWSFFRIAMGLGIGISAGIGEEALFRGFIMT